ncbi:MAG: tyrosine-type recombinase/integrase [Fusobacteriaceae bacterium]|jgi:integrase/recombinase XerD|nr:tyrosine-type recombinase/integrase [Fusobacteriaceae bacterium]
MEIQNYRGGLTATRKKRGDRDQGAQLFEIYKSEKTLKDYQYNLEKFLQFVYEGESRISGNELVPLMVNVSVSDAEEYIVYLLQKRKLKKTSVNTILSALKSLFKELEHLEGVTDAGYTNPFRGIKLFKTQRDLTRILKISKDDIKTIIGLYKVGTHLDYRNMVILVTLYYTGMRSSELLQLKGKHILSRDGNLYLVLEKTKSGREQYKPLHPELVSLLTEYQDYVTTLSGISAEELRERYLFSASDDHLKPLSYRALYDIIHHMGQAIAKDISPHSIRHSVATELSLNGADLIEIRDFLGHADTKVTEVYVNARNLIEKKTLEKIPELNSNSE